MTTHQLEPVVAAVDGSASADRALRWAAAEAGLRGRPLRLVHAYPCPDGTEQLRDSLRGGSAQTLRRAVHLARQSAPGVEVSSASLPGATVSALVAESRVAAMVVVGAGEFTDPPGSVGVGLTADSSCPVVIVRGFGELPRSGPVVLGVDGSPDSEAAVPFAFEAASLRGAPLLAVHVWSELLDEAACWQGYRTVDWSPREDEAKAVLAERLAGWHEKFPDVEVVRVVRRGSAARTLLHRSTTARLLVIGAGGHGGLVGPGTGSTGHALIRHADVPVAVVRPDRTSGGYPPKADGPARTGDSPLPADPAPGVC